MCPWIYRNQVSTAQKSCSWHLQSCSHCFSPECLHSSRAHLISDLTWSLSTSCVWTVEKGSEVGWCWQRHTSENRRVFLLYWVNFFISLRSKISLFPAGFCSRLDNCWSCSICTFFMQFKHSELYAAVVNCYQWTDWSISWLIGPIFDIFH